MGGQVSAWDYRDKHVDGSIDAQSFVNSMHILIYAAATDVDSSGNITVTPFVPIGAIQGYSWGENRVIEQIFEIGSEIPYTVPGRTTGQLNLSRILINGADLANVLYHASESGLEDIDEENIIRTLRDISKPFHMLFVAFNNPQSGQTADVKYSRVYTNCWINARSESFSANQVLVAENVSIVYETVPRVTISTK